MAYEQLNVDQVTVAATRVQGSGRRHQSIARATSTVAEPMA